MRPRALALAACLLAAAAGCAESAKYRVKAESVPYQGWFATYPSGLRLVVYQMPQADRFMLSASYDAGAVQDPPGRAGLAHLVEHLVFRARPQGPRAPRLDEWLAGSGWRFEAETAQDHTDYWVVGKPRELAAALAVEAARMRDPIANVTPEDFAAERDVVIAEHRERFESDPTGAAVRELVALAFAGHPYAAGVTGSPESLARITVDDARAWVAARYRPGGAVVTVVSPLPTGEVAAHVERAFGPLLSAKTGRPPPRFDPPDLPARAPPATGLVRAPVDRPSLWVAWSVPGRNAADIPYPEVVRFALDRAISDQLQKRWLTEDVGFLDTGFADVGSAGLLWARLELRAERHADRALEAVRAAASELPGLARGLSPGSMERYADWVVVQGYLQLEEVEAPIIASFLRATGNPDYLGEWKRRVSEQMQTGFYDFAKRWVTEERAAALLVAPDRNVGPRTLDAPVPKAPPREDPLEDAARDVPVPGADGVLEVATAPGLDRAERRTLANGLDVVVAQRGLVPIAEARLVLRTPPEGSPGVPPGLPRLALSFSADLFASSRLARVGASGTTVFASERVATRQRATAANLDVLLEALGRWARERTFDEPAFQAAQRALERRIAWYRASPAKRAGVALRARLFPGHAYGVEATAEGILAISPGQARRWLRDHLRPDRATLIVVTNRPVTPQIWEEIERHFAGWSAPDAAPNAAVPEPPLPPPGAPVLVIDRPGATQSLVLAGFRAPPARGRDEPAAEAMRWLLHSRLNRRLRSEEGVSYGVAVFPIEHARAAALAVATNVDRRATAGAVRAIAGGLAALAAEPVDGAASARARWNVARGFAFRFDTVSASADALEELAREGRAPDAWEQLPASIAAITPERIQAAARAVETDRPALVVLGDAATVRPQLEAAGFAVEVQDEGAATARR